MLALAMVINRLPDHRFDCTSSHRDKARIRAAADYGKSEESPPSENRHALAGDRFDRHLAN